MSVDRAVPGPTYAFPGNGNFDTAEADECLNQHVAFTIRNAEVDDAAPIARAHVAAWQAAYKGLVPQDYLDALDVGERTALWRSILTGEITAPGVPRPTDFVIEDDNRLVGFVNVGRFRDQPNDATAGELWAMYVHPDAWGTGAGDQLMIATLDELVRLESTTSYLWVLEGNDRARRFYERHGWTSEGIIKTFDANTSQVPEIRYSRPINEQDAVASPRI